MLSSVCLDDRADQFVLASPSKPPKEINTSCLPICQVGSDWAQSQGLSMESVRVSQR